MHSCTHNTHTHTHTHTYIHTYIHKSKKNWSDPFTGPVWPRGWVELYLYSSMAAALEGVSGQQHSPAAIYPEKDPVPILQEAGWAPSPVWRCGKPRPHRDSIPNYPARSQSLYRLSYPAHNVFLRSYLQSGLRHTFLISDTYHPDILYYESRNVEIPGFFWKPKGVREQKVLETLMQIIWRQDYVL